jgi:hypothetical protein
MLHHEGIQLVSILISADAVLDAEKRFHAVNYRYKSDS